MACIYKITNKVNNKVYIGKTERVFKTRWLEHKRTIYNYDKDSKLYRAMRKYGIENFIPEIIENVEDVSLLGEKERFYIELYDSYYNGYNSTFGGDGESPVNFNIIESLFLQGLNYTQISEKTGYTRKTISNLLRGHGYTTRQIPGNKDKGKEIVFNGNTFPSHRILARFLIENEEPFKNKTLHAVEKGISNAIKNNGSYLGYNFETKIR